MTKTYEIRQKTIFRGFIEKVPPSIAFDLFEDGALVGRFHTETEAIEVRDARINDEAEYQAMVKSSGVPEWQFLDENSEG